MLYIYHYNALYQTQAGSIHHIDGIATSGKPIMDYDSYKRLKLEIAGDSIPVDKLTLSSLTLLHTQ